MTNPLYWLVTITDEDEEKGFFGFFRKAGNKVSANCCEVQAGVEGGVHGTVPR